MANKNLTGQTIAESYQQTLIVNAEAGVTGQTSTATQIMCGTATAEGGAGTTLTTPLYVSRDRVGIGTDSPDAPLSIKSSGTSSVLQSYIKSSDANHIIEFEEGGAGQGIIEVKNASGGTAKIRLDGAGDTWFNGGDVGIGTTAPAYPLEVAGSGTDEYVALFDNTGSDAASHGIKIMAGDSDHADSTTVYLSFYESDAGAVGDVDSDGGTLAFSDASDERLKKNIRDTELNALSGINSLQMRDFEWKKSGKTIECGLIAQELETVYPHLVKQFDDADKTYGIRKTGFIYVLMKAVQELSAKVTALENA